MWALLYFKGGYMLVRDVLESARSRLGDIDKTGWTDDRLLSLINAGQRDLCRRSSIYRHKVYMDLTNGIGVYTLPHDCYNITRIELDGKQLPIYSREDITNTKVPQTPCAIKSNLNRSQIEITPIPTNISKFDLYHEGTKVEDLVDIANPLGVVSNVPKGAQVMQALGTVSGIHDLPTCNPLTMFGELSSIGRNSALAGEQDLLGVVTSFEPSKTKAEYGFLNAIGTTQVAGTYGITTHASFGANYIVVYYDAVPPRVQWVNGALYIEDLWLSALVYYVVGNARQDDNDEGNYKIGIEELKKYEEEVKKAGKISAKSFNSQVGVVRETIYRRF